MSIFDQKIHIFYLKKSIVIDPEIDRKSVGQSSDRSIGRSVDFPLISGNFWATVDFGPKIFDFPGGGPVLVSSRGQMNRPPGWGDHPGCPWGHLRWGHPGFSSMGQPHTKKHAYLTFSAAWDPMHVWGGVVTFRVGSVFKALVRLNWPTNGCKKYVCVFFL